MRLTRLLIALACIAAGAAVGALNPQPLTVDLGFVVVPTTLGVAILLALLVGAIIGGLMLAFSVVLPLRRQLKRGTTRMPTSPTPTQSPAPDDRT